MAFSADQLAVPAFAERLAAVLAQAVDELGLQWAAVADLSAPSGHAALRWRAAAPHVPELAPSTADLAVWLAATDDGPFAIALHVEPAIGVPHDAVLVVAGRRVAPDELAPLVTCLERGLSEDRRGRLASWVLAAVDQATDPIELTDREAHFVYTNAAWQRTFGYPPASSLSRTPRQLFRDGPDDRPVDHAFFQFSLDAIRRGEPWLGTLTNRTRDGEPIMVEASVARFTSPDADFEGNVAIRRRLDHRAARDSALMSAHREFREILAAIPDGVVVLRDERIYFVNAAFCTIVGRPEADLIRRMPDELVHTDDHGHIAAPRADSPALRFLRPDGSSRLVEATIAGAVSFEGAPATILLLRDTTDRRLAEERMVHGEKLTALGLLAAGVAHEINNPLSYIASNLELLASDQTEVAARPELLHEAIEGARRIRVIADDLRNFSAVDQAGAPEPVDLGKAIGSALNLTANEIRHRARLVRDDAPDLFVMAREGPLVQVLVVVLTNAAQAIPDGASASHQILLATHADQQTVELAISDTGVGIPADMIARVFEPFASSKGQTKGTGLGLAIAKRIVEESHGTIRLEPRRAGGTTVRITLPRAEPPTATQAVVASIATPSQPRRGRVLIIDDDVLVARVVSRILAAHDVTVATDAREAMLALETADVDVVLCDLMMPDVPGSTLYRQVIARRPELAERFIFMTGGVFTDAASEFVESLGTKVLVKPFHAETLRERVMERILLRAAT